MEHLLVVGDYEITYCAVELNARFHAKVSVRLRRRDENDRVSTCTYFDAHDTAEAALEEARLKAERAQASPQTWGWGR